MTARNNPAVRAAIAGIDPGSWVPIRYPNAVWDEAEQRLVSDAEVAETGFTAFTSRPRAEQVTARLIVRRVRRLNPATAASGQAELFPGHRHQAVFTDSGLSMLDAEAVHRDHAIVEQVIADLKSSALAHLPSGRFTANAAWIRAEPSTPVGASCYASDQDGVGDRRRSAEYQSVAESCTAGLPVRYAR